MPQKSGEMPFLEHLEELRRRLIVSLLSVLIFSIAGYVVSEHMLGYLIRHSGQLHEVYFMGITEAFAVRIKVSLFFGLFVSLPVIFYQAWQFVAPGLYPRESALIFPLILVMCLFFLAGAAFCFYVVLPLGIRFLIEFGTDELKPLISVGRYVSFVGWMVVAFGALFELPVVTFVLGRLGLVSARTLRRGRRYAVVGILIVAALVTPSPDVFSQLLLAVPLYLLYEISVALVAVTGKKRGIEGEEAVSDA